MIVNHTDSSYNYRRILSGENKYNGAFFYSKEICSRIIPNVKTDRNWITVNVPGACYDHSIVFIHNNKNIKNYEWLKKYKDLILVCGIPETIPKVEHLGKAIYLPLSINVPEVEAYKCPKTKGRAYCGRPAKRRDVCLPDDVEYIEGVRRPEFLAKMAQYKQVYAVGRAALEAKALGCEILPYDPRFPDPERWQVLDNLEAAAMLQTLLDEIDKGNGHD